MYKKVEVKVENAKSKKLEVKIELRQDDVLSPIVFNLILEEMIRKIKIERDEGQILDRSSFDLLTYANDMVLAYENITYIYYLWKRPLGRLKLRWEDGVKGEVEKIEPGVKWREVAEDRDRWESLTFAGWS
ncbi:Uncharacterized protein FWK35_00016253 [Aphis craccivora]|uniref:Reverse transcriptase domain-containing protein n=1 Tax=Aphis craccivora TaxID=307492 RepID=A0A6G0Z423_APHCR|nr:Uncharacterized protein FWK35_00016253 [Aphis craccivora]